MTDDIVTHLRNQHELKKLAYPELCKNTKTIYEEAADEIERLRNALAEQTIIHEVQKTNTLNEIERLRAALALAVNELSRHGQYSVYSSEQLTQQFLEEDR